MKFFSSDKYKRFGQEFSLTYRQLILIFAIVVIVGVLQNTDSLNILGVKPNISLAVLITLSFFVTETLHYLILIIIAGGFMRFGPGSEIAVLVFSLLALIAFFISDKLPGKVFVNNIFLIAFTTVVFYVMTNFSLIYSDFFTMFTEMIYNIILGIVFLYALNKLLKHGKI